MPPTDEAIRLARLQAVFYIVTGIWPFVSIRSFEAVTGPKVDRWLVKTVGALVAVIGAALALASRRRQVAPEIVVVAAGSAAALAAIDTVYVAKRRISPVYLLDAVAEIALVAGWAQLWWRGSSDSTGTSRQGWIRSLLSRGQADDYRRSDNTIGPQPVDCGADVRRVISVGKRRTMIG